MERNLEKTKEEFDVTIKCFVTRCFFLPIIVKRRSARGHYISGVVERVSEKSYFYRTLKIN